MQSFNVHIRRLSIQPFTASKVQPYLRPASAVVLPSVNNINQAQQQQHLKQLLCPQRLQLKQPRMLVGSRASSNDSSGSSSSNGQPSGSILGWFDRLSPRVQLGIMGALLFVGMFVIPFLQPTFMYGDNSSSKTASQQQITNVQEATSGGEQQLYKLPRYIPVASELYDFLQENAMPTKTPDGRNESPGVLRIYLSSMIILALFYVCSGIVGLVLRSVATILRAAKIMGPPKPQE